MHSGAWPPACTPKLPSTWVPQCAAGMAESTCSLQQAVLEQAGMLCPAVTPPGRLLLAATPAVYDMRRTCRNAPAPAPGPCRRHRACRPAGPCCRADPPAHRGPPSHGRPASPCRRGPPAAPCQQWRRRAPPARAPAAAARGRLQTRAHGRSRRPGGRVSRCAAPGSAARYGRRRQAVPRRRRRDRPLRRPLHHPHHQSPAAGACLQEGRKLKLSAAGRQQRGHGCNGGLSVMTTART